MTNKKGITLIEICISTALLSILIIGLINFMIENKSTTKHFLEQSDNLRETRMALSYMERDIREGHGIYQAVDNEEFLSFTIKRVIEIVTENADDDKVEYITYNYLKKDKKIDGKNLKAGSLTRERSITKPEKGYLTSKKIIVNSSIDNKTNKIIGLVPEGEIILPDKSIHKFISGVMFYNKYYDATYIHDKDQSADNIKKMNALHTWKGKFGDVEIGYKDIQKTIAIRIKFYIGDSHGNYNLFQTIAYMRCMMLGRRQI